MPRANEYTRFPTTTVRPCGLSCRREPLVGVQGVMVHRDHAEEVIVRFGDRLAGPVPVDVADREVLERAAERPIVHGHPLARHRIVIVAIPSVGSRSERSGLIGTGAGREAEGRSG